MERLVVDAARSERGSRTKGDEKDSINVEEKTWFALCTDARQLFTTLASTCRTASATARAAMPLLQLTNNVCSAGVSVRATGRQLDRYNGNI